MSPGSFVCFAATVGSTCPLSFCELAAFYGDCFSYDPLHYRLRVIDMIGVIEQNM